MNKMSYWCTYLKFRKHFSLIEDRTFKRNCGSLLAVAVILVALIMYGHLRQTPRAPILGIQIRE